MSVLPLLAFEAAGKGAAQGRQRGRVPVQPAHGQSVRLRPEGPRQARGLARDLWRRLVRPVQPSPVAPARGWFPQGSTGQLVLWHGGLRPRAGFIPALRNLDHGVRGWRAESAHRCRIPLAGPRPTRTPRQGRRCPEGLLQPPSPPGRSQPPCEWRDRHSRSSR